MPNFIYLPKNYCMKQITLNQIKKDIQKVYKIYSKLSESWNGATKNGDDTNFPITVIVEVLLQNMAFNASNCHDYSLEGAVEELYSKMKLLEELNDYNNKGYMTHFPYKECSLIIEAYSMGEYCDSESETNNQLYE